MATSFSRIHRIQMRRGVYKHLMAIDEVFLDGEIIVVTGLPWNKSCFGRKPTRIKVGDGKTPFSKLHFI